MRNLAILPIALLLAWPAASEPLRTGDIAVLDSELGTITRVKPSTGNRSFVSTGSDFAQLFGTESIAQHPDGQLLVTDSHPESVVEVDPVNGVSLVLSGRATFGILGSGPPLDFPNGIDVAGDGTLFVVDTRQRHILAIDARTGDRAIVSSNSVGSGRGFGIGMGDPGAAAFDPSGRLLVGVGAEYVYAIDPATGDRSVLTGPAPEDPNLRFFSILDLAVESPESFLVVSNSQEAVYRVSSATGQRSVVSSSRAVNPRGAGPDFSNPIGIAIAPDGEILVADASVRAILGVDPVTGDRRVVSGPGVGAGPAFGTPRRLLVTGFPEPGPPGPILGIDSLDALYDVEPDRGLLIPRGRVSIPGFFVGMDVGPDGQLFGVTTGRDLYAIDPATAEAVLIAQQDGTFSEGDIAFDPVSGELFGVGGLDIGRALVTIDIETGEFTPIRIFDDGDFSAMVFRPDGLLNLIDTFGRRVVTVDPVSGETIASRPVVFRYPGGIGRVELAGPLAGAIFEEDRGAMLIAAGNSLYSLPLDALEGTFLGTTRPGTVVLSGLTRLVNSPPRAEAGDDRVVECSGPAGTDVVLDASGSSDPDEDPLTFTWTNSFGSADGEIARVVLGLGSQEITLVVDDGRGGVDDDSVEIHVVDNRPPEIDCGAPDAITPNQGPTAIRALIADACDEDPIAEVVGFDCFDLTRKGKRIDKTGSCRVEVTGDTLTVDHGGGVGTRIEWSLRAVDASGNTSELVCGLEVANPPLRGRLAN